VEILFVEVDEFLVTREFLWSFCLIATVLADEAGFLRMSLDVVVQVVLGPKGFITVWTPV